MEEKKNLEKKENRGGKRAGAGRKALTQNNTMRFGMFISPDFRKKLDFFSKKEGLTISDFLRKLVEDYEKTHRPES